MSPARGAKNKAKDDLFNIPEHPFIKKSKHKMSFGEDSFEEIQTPYLAGEKKTDLQHPKETILAT